MAAAVARSHGRTVYLRPPSTGPITLTSGQPAARPAGTVQHAAIASVADDSHTFSASPGGAQVGRADRVYEVQAASLGAGVAPERGWSLYDPQLAASPGGGVLEILAVETGADGAVLRVSTRRSR